MNLYTKVSIIALGETGCGKSLFCKLFSKSEIFESKRSTESVTTQINSLTFINEEKKAEIFLIDTPGSNDSRGPEQEKENLKLTRKFISEQQRINCIIIVMNFQNPRFSDSIKTSIRNICQSFPLPEFWSHVIIFWTHCKFENEEEEKEQIKDIEKDIKEGFIKLSEDIERDFHIKKIEENQILNMIYNEYDERTRREEIIKKNYTKTEENFGKIIDLVKNMKPLYEIVYPPEEKVVLQDPKEGKIVGNTREFTYYKIRIRKYKDFGNPNIIQNEEIFGTFIITMHEKETDWEFLENRENIKIYIKNKIRTFYDENRNEFNPIDINIPLIEKCGEKRVETKKKEEIINNNRKKIFKVDYVFYPETNKKTEENKIFIKEIEEGETDWEQDTNFNQPNIKKYNKYKTTTEYDINGNKVGNTLIDRQIIKDWKKIETIVENNIRIRMTDKITRVIKKTTKKETKKNDENPRIIEEKEEQTSLEEIKEEFEKINNLNENHLGTIEYNYYNVKYINNVKNENEKIKNVSKSYVQTYIESNEVKSIKEKQNQYEYQISYHEIYITDSRTPNAKQETPYKIILDRKIINFIKENFVEERFENNEVIQQKYIMYYINNSEGNKVLDHKDEDGPEKREPIKYGEEYCEIEEPMTIEKINELKHKKEYPINYVNIYYQDEINTLRKEKKRVRTEEVEIKMEPNKILTKNIPDKNVIINYEYNELYFINGVYKKTIPNNIEKRYDLLVDVKEDKMIDLNKIIKYKNETWYYIDEFQQKNIIDTIYDSQSEEIEYGKEYSEIENPMTISEINELKKEKHYPINYVNIYYQDEINTGRENRRRTRTEKVEIKMDKKRTIKMGNDKEHVIIIDDYSELYYYDGEFREEKKLEHDEKICNIFHEYEKNKFDREDKVITRTIDNLYYIDDGKKVFYKKEEKEDSEHIYYGEEYCEIEVPMTIEKINELKHKKKYPINYVNIYYIKSLNAVKERKKITRIERVELKLEHKINKMLDDKDRAIINVEEYDIEKKYINGELVETRDDIKLNLIRKTESNIDRIIEYTTKEFVKDNTHFFSKNEHIYDIYKIKKIIYKDGKSEEIRNYVEQEINRYD